MHLDWSMGEFDPEGSGKEDMVEFGIPGLVFSTKLLILYLVCPLPYWIS